MSTLIVRPTADFSTADWTSAVPATSNWYSCVDEEILSTADYVLYQVSDPSGYRLMIVGDGTAYSSTASLPSSDTYTNFSHQFNNNPSGGSWSVSDLSTSNFKFGVESGSGGYLDQEVLFRCNTSLPDLSGATINHVTVKGNIGRHAPKFGQHEIYLTQIYYEVDYEPSDDSLPAPTNLQVDNSANPTYVQTDKPAFSAIFNGDSGNEIASSAQMQVSSTSDWSSENDMVWGWDTSQPYISLYSNCNENSRCTKIRYDGDYLKNDVEYKWRIRFKTTEGTATGWSTARATFKGFQERSWQDLNYNYRRRLNFSDVHPELPSGSTLSFPLYSGHKKIVARNGAFNEAIQSGGHDHLTYYDGKLHVTYLAKNEGQSAKYNVYINSYDYFSERWGTPYGITELTTDFDTHYFPTIAVDNSGKIHVCLSGHHSHSDHYISSASNISGAFSGEDPGWALKYTFSGAYTYPMLVNVPSANRMYVFMREGVDDAAYNYYMYYSQNPSASTPDWTGPLAIIEYNSLNDTGGFMNDYRNRTYAYSLVLDEERDRFHLSFTFLDSVFGSVQYAEGVWYAYSDYSTAVYNVGSPIGNTSPGFSVWYTHSSSGTDQQIGLTKYPDVGGVGYNKPMDRNFRAIYDSFNNTYNTARVMNCFSTDMCLYRHTSGSLEPLLFYEFFNAGRYQNFHHEADVACAKWDYTNNSWTVSNVSEQLDLQMKAIRHGIPAGADVSGNINAYMAVAARPYVHAQPAFDVSTSNISLSSGNDVYPLLDDGNAYCDGHSSYAILHNSASYVMLGSTSVSSNPSFDLWGDDITVIELQVYGILRNSAYSGEAKIKYMLSSAGDISTVYGAEQNTYTNQFDYFAETWKTDPFNDTAWTASSISSANFGIIVTSTGETVCVSKLCKRIRYTKGIDKDNVSTEVYRLYSSDNGDTWSAEPLNMNSFYGSPILNSYKKMINQSIHLVWTAGNNVFHATDRDRLWGKMDVTGEDVRLYYGDTEIDRIIDWPGTQESEVYFKLQATVEANHERGPIDYYLLYGNQSLTDRPKGDPDNVYQYFENFEDMGVDQKIHHYDSNWSSADSFVGYQSPILHTNKIGAGIACLSGSGRTTNTVSATGINRVKIHWNMWSNFFATAYFKIVDTGGSITSFGTYNDEEYPYYSFGTSWSYSTSERGKAGQQLHLSVDLNDNGSTLYFNRERLFTSTSGAKNLSSIGFHYNAPGISSWLDHIWVENYFYLEGACFTTSEGSSISDRSISIKNTELSNYLGVLDGKHDFYKKNSAHVYVDTFDIKIKAKDTEQKSENLHTASYNLFLATSSAYSASNVVSSVRFDLGGVNSATFVNTTLTFGINQSGDYEFNLTKFKSFKAGVHAYNGPGEGYPSNEFQSEIEYIYTSCADIHPNITLEDEEEQGFHMDFTLLGKGVDSFIMDFYLSGYLLTDAMNMFIRASEVIEDVTKFTIRSSEIITDNIDIFIKAYGVDSDKTNLIIHPYDDITDDLELFVRASEEINDYSNIIIKEYDTYSDKTNFTIHADDTTSDDVDLFIRGYEVEEDTSKFLIKVNEVITDYVSLLTYIFEDIDLYRSIIIEAKEELNENFDLFIKADDVASDRVSITIYASYIIEHYINFIINVYGVLKDNIDIFIRVEEGISDTVAFLVESYNLESEAINLFIREEEYISEGMNFTIRAFDIVDDKIPMFISEYGITEENVDLFITVDDVLSDKINLFIKGSEVISDKFDLFTSSYGVFSDYLNFMVALSTATTEDIDLFVKSEDDIIDTTKILIRAYEYILDKIMFFIKGYYDIRNQIDFFVKVQDSATDCVGITIHSIPYLDEYRKMFISSYGVLSDAMKFFVWDYAPGVKTEYIKLTIRSETYVEEMLRFVMKASEVQENKIPFTVQSVGYETDGINIVCTVYDQIYDILSIIVDAVDYSNEYISSIISTYDVVTNSRGIFLTSKVLDRKVMIYDNRENVVKITSYPKVRVYRPREQYDE